jgi:hypothetical protein
MIIRFLIFAVMFYCGGAKAQEPPVRWEPVPSGVVLTRNFMVPQSPEKEGFRLLPAKYRLGSKAYAKAPPDWWLQLVIDAKVNVKWHPKDFPLAYAGEFKSKDGSVALLVVQASQSFTGDGFFSPGPVVYLVARLFSKGDGGPKLLTEQACAIGDVDGSFQYSRLLAGEANGRRILFRTDGGPDFDSRKITHQQNWTLSLGDTNSITIERGDYRMIDPKKEFDEWYARFGSDVHGVRYQGSVEQSHYFVALIGTTWRSFRFDKDELKLAEERAVPTPLEGTNAFYAVDPGRHFQKIEIQRGGQPDGAANRSQPIRSETNPTPSAAGSRR